MLDLIIQIGKTGIGKALILIWVLATVIFISILLLGFFQHQFSGNAAFGFLLSSVLLNISILLSNKVEAGSVQIAKLAWMVLGILILGFTLYLFDGKPNSDIAEFLVWAMLVHSFPIGLLVNLLFAGVSYLLYDAFSVIPSVGYTYLSIIWLAFFAAGYIQWFKLLPLLLAKFRRK